MIVNGRKTGQGGRSSTSAGMPVPRAMPAGRRRSLAIIALLFLMQLADGIDQTALAFTAPAVRASLGLGAEALGAAFSAAFIGTALGSILFGTISDRIGRRLALTTAATCFSAGSLCTILATGSGSLFAVRLLTGIALGGLFPVVAAIILDTVDHGLRATAVTIVSIGTAAGAAACGPLAALIEPRFGWQAVFVMGAAVPALLLLPAIRLVPPRTTTPAPAAYPVRNPLDSLAPLFGEDRGPMTLLVWTGFLSASIPMFFSLSWLPSLAHSAHLGPRAAALGPAIFSLSGMAVAVIVARIIDRVGIGALAMSSALGIPAFMLLSRSLDAEPRFLVACAAAGAISVSSVNLMGTVAALLYPAELRARGVGWAVAVMRLGGAAAPALGGVLLANDVAPDRILAGLALAPAITAWAVWRLRVSAPARA